MYALRAIPRVMEMAAIGHPPGRMRTEVRYRSFARQKDHHRALWD